MQEENKIEIKHFYLNRIIDESGMSGLGKVAEGVELPNGACVMWWLVEPHSIQIYKSVDDLHYIHRHGKKNTTELVYDSTPQPQEECKNPECPYRKDYPHHTPTSVTPPSQGEEEWGEIVHQIESYPTYDEMLEFIKEKKHLWEQSAIQSYKERAVREIEEFMKGIEDSEAFGYELLDERCCPGDDTFYGFEKGMERAKSIIKKEN